MKIAFEVQDEGLSESEIDLVRKEMNELKIVLSNLSIYGFSVEVVRESLQPLAMSNVRTVVRVWRR